MITPNSGSVRPTKFEDLGFLYWALKNTFTQPSLEIWASFIGPLEHVHPNKFEDLSFLYWTLKNTFTQPSLKIWASFIGLLEYVDSLLGFIYWAFKKIIIIIGLNLKKIKHDK